MDFREKKQMIEFYIAAEKSKNTERFYVFPKCPLVMDVVVDEDYMKCAQNLELYVEKPKPGTSNLWPT